MDIFSDDVANRMQDSCPADENATRTIMRQMVYGSVMRVNLANFSKLRRVLPEQFSRVVNEVSGIFDVWLHIVMVIF